MHWIPCSSRAVEEEHLLPFLCAIPTPSPQFQCHNCLHCLLLLCLFQRDPRGSSCPCLYSGCLLWGLRHGPRSVNLRSPHARDRAWTTKQAMWTVKKVELEGWAWAPSWLDSTDNTVMSIHTILPKRDSKDKVWQIWAGEKIISLFSHYSSLWNQVQIE